MPSISEQITADRQRSTYALARGLPETTSWTEIIAHDEDEHRKRKARRYCLPDSASLQEISRHEEHLRSMRRLEEIEADARELGLPMRSSQVEIDQARNALPIGQYHRQYPVDRHGNALSDDSDLG